MCYETLKLWGSIPTQIQDQAKIFHQPCPKTCSLVAEHKDSSYDIETNWSQMAYLDSPRSITPDSTHVKPRDCQAKGWWFNSNTRQTHFFFFFFTIWAMKFHHRKYVLNKERKD